jgi:hypothetical protein
MTLKNNWDLTNEELTAMDYGGFMSVNNGGIAPTESLKNSKHLEGT